MPDRNFWRQSARVWLILTLGVLVFSVLATGIQFLTHNSDSATFVAFAITCPIAVWVYLVPSTTFRLRKALFRRKS